MGGLDNPLETMRVRLSKSAFLGFEKSEHIQTDYSEMVDFRRHQRRSMYSSLPFSFFLQKSFSGSFDLIFTIMNLFLLSAFMFYW